MWVADGEEIKRTVAWKSGINFGFPIAKKHFMFMARD
jgi:hypothetical protein